MPSLCKRRNSRSRAGVRHWSRQDRAHCKRARAYTRGRRAERGGDAGGGSRVISTHRVHVERNVAADGHPNARPPRDFPCNATAEWGGGWVGGGTAPTARTHQAPQRNPAKRGRMTHCVEAQANTRRRDEWLERGRGARHLQPQPRPPAKEESPTRGAAQGGGGTRGWDVAYPFSPSPPGQSISTGACLSAPAAGQAHTNQSSHATTHRHMHAGKSASRGGGPTKRGDQANNSFPCSGEARKKMANPPPRHALTSLRLVNRPLRLSTMSDSTGTSPSSRWNRLHRGTTRRVGHAHQQAPCPPFPHSDPGPGSSGGCHHTGAHTTPRTSTRRVPACRAGGLGPPATTVR
jgi:hypothetical protein